MYELKIRFLFKSQVFDLDVNNQQFDNNTKKKIYGKMF